MKKLLDSGWKIQRVPQVGVITAHIICIEFDTDFNKMKQYKNDRNGENYFDDIAFGSEFEN